MTMTAERISTLRQVAFALTAMSCLAFAALALWQDRPDPLFWWLPGATGATAAAVLFAAAARAGNKQADLAYDEMYTTLHLRAGNAAFWWGLALTILSNVASAQGLFAPTT